MWRIYLQGQKVQLEKGRCGRHESSWVAYLPLLHQGLSNYILRYLHVANVDITYLQLQPTLWTCKSLHELNLFLVYGMFVGNIFSD